MLKRAPNNTVAETLLALEPAALPAGCRTRLPRPLRPCDARALRDPLLLLVPDRLDFDQRHHHRRCLPRDSGIVSRSAATIFRYTNLSSRAEHEVRSRRICIVNDLGRERIVRNKVPRYITSGASIPNNPSARTSSRSATAAVASRKVFRASSVSWSTWCLW